MEVLFLTFALLLLVIAAMAVGVIFGRKPIAGSCGGMSALGMDTACDICGGDKQICETEQEKQKAAQQAKATSELSYDATQR
ncbi:(Na+)-NQR maturation NqrM [Balneatrix alpica]|uniref:(Na+)-NQR maturation NqrM n=1 Tax=Balneatrix alpica TaxID=75684 RepID=A0ABV5Z8J4_9GAMM|nr:(Na+)-NQR maturation NqrM [Balneatrix alpica]